MADTMKDLHAMVALLMDVLRAADQPTLETLAAQDTIAGAFARRELEQRGIRAEVTP